MKKMIFLSLITIFVLLSGYQTGLPAGAEDLPAITIKLSHNQPLSSPEHAGAVAFKNAVEKMSDEKISVEIFPAMQLGSMREQLEAVQLGSHQLTIQPISVITPFVEELQIVDFPFLWPSKGLLYNVLDGEAGEELLEKAAAKGFKGFGFWGGGFKQFTTNGKEIHLPADFQGVKIRVMPSPLLIAQYKTWGANPIPIEYAELYNSLQQGIVDGQENPIQTIALNKFYEVQDNMILSNHGYLAYVFIGNKRWFEKLPTTYKEIIIKAEEEARRVERRELDDREAAFLKEIKESDINIYTLTEQEKEAFQKASLPIHDKFAADGEKKRLLTLIKEKISENN